MAALVLPFRSNANQMRRFTLLALLFLGSSGGLNAVAAEPLQYAISGTDTYVADGQHTTATYTGTERVQSALEGGHNRLGAIAQYVCVDWSGRHTRQAAFEQEVDADGNARDTADSDPDAITILNQPMAYIVDARTWALLRDGHHSIAFNGSSLGYDGMNGVLQTRSSPTHSVIVVRFAARGPVRGHERGVAPLNATVEVNGIAYYSAAAQRLISVDMTMHVYAKRGTSTAAISSHRVISLVR